MECFDEFLDIMRKLRSKDGCPWDSTQTHKSLKPCCIEEACEVIAGINLLSETGECASLREELGDLLMGIILQALIAEEEGLFTLDDVIKEVSDKMIRRHPNVFGKEAAAKAAGVAIEDVRTTWNEIKQQEKAGKEFLDEKLPEAFLESKELIDRARRRKHLI